MDRIHLIKEQLTHSFSPTQLEVLDDSDQHKGHVGSQGGAGHYTVIIAAEYLNNLSRVEAHRKIYSVLQDLIPNQIHALKIKILQKD